MVEGQDINEEWTHLDRVLCHPDSLRPVLNQSKPARWRSLRRRQCDELADFARTDSATRTAPPDRTHPLRKPSARLSAFAIGGISVAPASRIAQFEETSS